MKQFTINVHFDMVVQETVIAKDLDEAKKIAMANACTRKLETEGDCAGTDSCLVDEKEVNLSEFDRVSIFKIFKDNDGVKNIKFLCYFYSNDHGWAHVEFCDFQMPLDVYLANKEKYDQWEETVKQYVTEMTQEQVVEAFNNYAAKPIGNILTNLTEKTPEGINFYIQNHTKSQTTLH